MNFRNLQTNISVNTSQLIPALVLTVTLGLTTVACAPDNSPAAAGGPIVTNKSVTPGPLPELHKIQSYEFAAPYSCKGSYERSALFLSATSKERNGPELLFNGACGSELEFNVTTAGDDFGFIADLGTVTIESVTASKAFNYKNVSGSDNEFRKNATVVVGHTYAVVNSRRDLRTLFIVHVEEILPNGRLRISYVVKSYSIHTSTTEVPGFEWSKENTWK